MSSAAKTTQPFDLPRAACGRQFRFNPRRITGSMGHLGKKGHGKNLLHVFRDAEMHSPIVLQGTFAPLRITRGEKPHWREPEQAHYRESDAEMDAANAPRQAAVEFARNSPPPLAHRAELLAHRAELLAHHGNSPAYVGGSANPREAARPLIATLLAAGGTAELPAP